MPAHLATDATLLAWTGAILLLAGEIAALRAIASLPRLLLFSTLAETGYVLIGFGLGSDAGSTGAIMHFGYQLVMRGLLVLTAWWLIRRSGSARLEDLAGSIARMPLVTTLFAFAMFSVMGLSPFKGSFSKFIVLYAAIEQGYWLLAAAGTAASIIAAVYSLQVIQRLCFEAPVRPLELASEPSAAVWPAVLLTVTTVVMSLWPEPFLHTAAQVAGHGRIEGIPQFETPWSLLVLLPYLGGFALYAIGLHSRLMRDLQAVLLAFLTLVLAAAMPQPDAASQLFAVLVAAVVFLVVLYSWGYMGHARRSNRYWFFLFLMEGSLLGLASAHEFGNFYVFWELMTWTSYFLVVHEQTPQALRAGFIYFVMCAAGAYVMNFGILLLHAQTGSFEFAVIAARAADIAPATGLVIVLSLFAGFAVKAGLVPLHAWLPLAHPEAPASISAPLSGILTKAGLFGMIKVLFAVFGAGALARYAGAGIDIGTLMLLAGAATLIWGEYQALMQTELKRMLAWSTLAQIGEIAVVLALGTTLATSAALLHVTNHALMKTLLFFGAGAFILQSGRRLLPELAGLGRVMPVSAGCYAIATVAIMGLPPFNGFISKFLMILAAADAGRPDVAALILAGSIVAAFYYLRIVRLLFFQPWQGPAVSEAPATMLAAMMLLATAIVAGGLAPGFQLDAVRAVAAEIAARSNLAAPMLPDLTLSWPAGAFVAAVGAVLVWLLGRIEAEGARQLAIAVPALAFVAVLLQPERYDSLGYAFALLVAGVGTLNMAYATGYLAHHRHAEHRFYAAFALMMAGLIGLAGSRDLFGFFAFWELMSSWALYVALVHEESEDARREAMKYFLFNSAGAAFMFLGLALFAAAAGSFDFAAVAATVPAMPLPLAAGALVLVIAGLLMKAAMLPLRIDYQMHPATAPTPVSGYISAVLLKSGPYGVLKLMALLGGTTLVDRLGLAGGTPLLADAIAVIGGLTLLYAGAMAVIQTGIKRLLIYSTVCQLGYITMALAIGLGSGSALGVGGGLMHFVNHMLLKDVLFLCAGAIMVATGARTLDELGGLGRRMPVTFGIFLFAGLSLAGIPPLNGFASKWLIYVAAFESGHVLLGVAALIASLFTLAAMLKFAHAAFMGAPSAAAADAREAPFVMLAPMVLLALASAMIGVMPGLLLVPVAAIQTSLGLPALPATWTGPLPAAGGWHPALLTGLLAVFVWLGAAYLRLGRGAGVIRSPIHLCGDKGLPAAATQVGASNLYRVPESALRGLLHADPDTGYRDPPVAVDPHPAA
jgi:formate hydrogenlyase subunit 3/multisubunit Na+/H+ antiporter MnhD subunit